MYSDPMWIRLSDRVIVLAYVNTLTGDTVVISVQMMISVLINVPISKFCHRSGSICRVLSEFEVL